ncbi:MAG: HAD-IC family P-type ATPase [Propionibacteriaceae bacterium]|jgi:cation-transporting ATPase E|nr:HAD-IC family P-type ATPase [Propionibacteriaceae bacterium]
MDIASDLLIGGLTSDEVAQRIVEGRTNAVQRVTSRSLGQIIKANVFTRFNALLGALFVLVLLTGSYIDGLFGIALVLNSVLGIGQEWYAKRKLDSLAVLHAPTATVLRDGREVTIDTADLVQDDVVRLTMGDQVPADGPLLVTNALEIDESNLTGESDAIDKAVGDQVSSGTVVVAGSGLFRAAVVGEDTTAHKLAREAKVFTRAYSEVQASTNRLLKWITWVVVVMFPVAIIAQIRGMHIASVDEALAQWRQIILLSAGGLVGLVPEGLVLLTTLAFLLAALQLTRQQALIQELPAVEGLARVDVICLDKTGTLTAGEIVFDKLELLPGADEATARQALGVIAHDPTPNATALAIAAAIEPGPRTVVDRVPFSSARKYSAVRLDDGSSWVFGAPEIVAGGDAALLARVEPLAANGVRVVVLAKADALVDWTQVTPVALVELSEAIRPDAADTLAYFASQEVGVKIISGDNPVTVAAVARRVGLNVATTVTDGVQELVLGDASSRPGQIVDARTLPDTVEELADLVEHITVFGRVTPEKKRLIVQALQSLGHTVAMTGDGVNDVLALKDADIGIAMGNGAQATKAVAQIVLLDSSFAHMPVVLAEGRRLIGNVERVASLFVTKNVMTTCLLLATAILGVTFPFLPRQMTLLSVLTIGIPAAVLALGPNKRKYVPGFLVRVLTLSIPAGVAAGLATFLAFALGRGDAAQASTLALAVLFIVNFWLLGVLARPWNWWKILTIAAMVVMAVCAFVFSLPREFFALSLPVGEWPLAIGLGACGAAIVEVAHRVRMTRSINRPVRLLDQEQHHQAAHPPM